MKKYSSQLQETEALTQILCNGCGREISLKGEDYFHGEKTWGYFSGQDGRKDSFDLCEDCYHKLTEGFSLSVAEK